MSRLLAPILAAALALALGLSPAAPAEGLSARARLQAPASSVRDEGDGLAVTLALSQPVPWRAFTLADPPRLVLDFREVDWRGSGAAGIVRADRATGLRTGAFRPGWSRLVLDLALPLAISRAGMETGEPDGSARLTVRLDPVSAEAMRAASGPLADTGWEAPAAQPRPPAVGTGPVTVVLDPGHGGIDPGAERDGVTEADLMLAFARELQDALVRSGDFRVVLTRTEDVFVPLDTRITLARAAGADIFLSLHADAVAEGRATGATVYTLSETASDEAAAALAERHDRADLLAGVDLSGQDDVIAGVLMDIARRDTQPRSEALADALVAGLAAAGSELHKRPRLAAGFSVLRAPDIPSALVELGFLSSDDDRDRLTSPEWRTAAARALAAGIQSWLDADAARAGLVRR